MTRHFIKIFTILIFLPMSAMAQTSPEKVAELLTLIGFDETFDDVRENVSSISGNGQIPTDTPLASVWPIAADQHFDSDEMLAQATLQLAGLLSDKEVESLLEIYSTDFALKITAIEEKEQNDLPSDQRTELGTGIATALANDAPERLRQYFEMIEMLGMLDSTVTLVMNMQYAFLSGASLTGLLPVPMSDDQIVASLGAMEPQIRSSMTNILVATTAYIYRDLSDADLAEYLDLLAIPEVTRMYSFIGQAMNDVMTREFAAFALKLGEIAPQSEL